MAEDDEKYEMEEENFGAEEVEAVEEIQETSAVETKQDAPARRAYYEEETITMKDVVDHIGGPIASIVIHIIIFIGLFFMALQETPKPQEEETVMKSEDVKIEPPPEIEEEIKEVTEMTEVTNPEFVDQIVDTVVMTDVPVDMPDVAAPPSESSGPVETAGSSFDDMSMATPSAPIVQTNNSSLKLRGAFSMRTPGGRQLAIKQYGGNGSTERAVEKALKWFVKVQNEDGSWGDEDDQYFQKVQLTCLALLAFLAHGENPGSEEYGEALMKGLQKVMEWNDQQRYICGYNYDSLDKDGNPKPIYRHLDEYARARICIVLSEGFAITRIPKLEKAMNKSVEWFIRNQNPLGGFRSWKNPKTGEWIHSTDLDMGNRIYNALYCAYNAGCEVEGMDKAIEKSISAMSTWHSIDTGGFSAGMLRDNKTGEPTHKGKPTFDASGAGTLFLYLMGYNGKAAKKGYEWLCEFKPGELSKGEPQDGAELRMDWKNLPSQTSALGWYYMTQALFQATGGNIKDKNWSRWNRSMIQSLTREQHKDGYWVCPADKYPDAHNVITIERNKNGKGKPKEIKNKRIFNESSDGGYSELNGRLWATVYFTLSLEVYYRYLPTFKPDGTRNPLADPKNTEGEGEDTASADSDSGEDEDDELSLD